MSDEQDESCRAAEVHPGADNRALEREVCSESCGCGTLEAQRDATDRSRGISGAGREGRRGEGQWPWVVAHSAGDKSSRVVERDRQRGRWCCQLELTEGEREMWMWFWEVLGIWR